jgi:hypothetical protein
VSSGSIFVLKNGRPSPQKRTPTVEEKIALNTLFAYVGSYTVEMDRVIYRLDGSEPNLAPARRQRDCSRLRMAVSST